MIPYLDLKAQYKSIKTEIDQAVANVLETNQYILGPEVAAFEKDFAAYCQADHALGVNSGTSALHLALLAVGVGPGDEVITVPFTFIATISAIQYAGAKPVLVDIDPKTFNMDVNKVEAAITPRTKAIMPVHLYGQPVDLDPILALAKKHKLFVIEDAAQAHGAEYKGKRVGALGDLGCFSFYPGKNLGAYGEGGAVTTNNPEYAKKVRMLRDWGTEKKYYHELKGFNYRLEGMQGAVLRVKLRHLEDWTKARIAHARTYSELFQGSGVETPQTMPYARHVFHAYTLRSVKRDKIQQALQEKGIQYGIHYPIPGHLQAAFADLKYGRGSFPVAEAAAEQVISLPIFPEITLEQQREVVDTVKKAID